jgi:hypothetical protein
MQLLAIAGQRRLRLPGRKGLMAGELLFGARLVAAGTTGTGGSMVVVSTADMEDLEAAVAERGDNAARSYPPVNYYTHPGKPGASGDFGDVGRWGMRERLKLSALRKQAFYVARRVRRRAAVRMRQCKVVGSLRGEERLDCKIENDCSRATVSPERVPVKVRNPPTAANLRTIQDGPQSTLSRRSTIRKLEFCTVS